jgi:hypothetical protein
MARITRMRRIVQCDRRKPRDLSKIHEDRA